MQVAMYGLARFRGLLKGAKTDDLSTVLKTITDHPNFTSYKELLTKLKEAKEKPEKDLKECFKVVLENNVLKELLSRKLYALEVADLKLVHLLDCIKNPGQTKPLIIVDTKTGQATVSSLTPVDLDAAIKQKAPIIGHEGFHYSKMSIQKRSSEV